MNANSTQTTDLWGVIEDYLAAERLELDDLELSGHGRGRLLRVTVDGDDLDVDRLAELSRGLSRLLDDDPSLQASYRLEVSSPGLERKLRRPSHYRKSLGREVVVRATGTEHKTTYRGTLTHVGDDTFIVEAEQGTRELSYDDVISATTVFRWERAPKPGH